MSGSDWQQQVLESVDAYLVLAGQTFECEFSSIEVRFDLKSRAAGMYVIKGEQRYLRFNPWLFTENPEENLRDTVPHEVAHYVVEQLFGRRGIKPHGREWRGVMAMFGAEASVRHTQDISAVPTRNITRVTYRCGCRQHQLSIIRHNRTQYQGARYYCRSCQQQLVRA